MNLSCRSFSRIAIAAIAVIMTVQIAIATPTSKPVRPDPSQIVAAGKTETRWFIGGLIWLIVSTLLTAWIGFMAWQASNKRQELEALDGNARISELRIELEKQRELTAKAQADLLQLQRQVAWRTINRKAFLAALEGQPQATVEILYLRDDPECMDVAQQIGQLLKEAKWEVTGWLPIPPGSPDLPTAMSSGGQPWGVCVVTYSASEEEADAGMNKIAGKPWVHTPWTVLQEAIAQSLGSVSAHAGGANTPPKGTLRVVVAPRR
jgi:hypothetical protein